MQQSTRVRAAVAVAAALVLTSGTHAQGSQSADGGQSVQPPAQVAVSPGKFEIEIGDKPVVESLRIMNFGDRDIAMKVHVVPWELDEKSRVVVTEPTEQSLDQWLIFNPREFTIRARSEQTVRFAIRPRVRPEDGEHRAMIYFEEQARDSEEVQGQMQVLLKLGIAVYAYAGDIRREGVFNGIVVAADPQIFGAQFDLSSLGNAHVRMVGQYAIFPLDDFPGTAAISLLEGITRDDFVPPTPIARAGLLPNTPVLAGTRRQLIMAERHQLPAGRYVLAVLGDLAGMEIRDAVEFNVPPAAPSAVAGQQQPDAPDSR